MPWLTAIIGLALAVTLYSVEPGSTAWLPKCPLHALTGWHCPGCGATRAAHALLHGDVPGALAKNPLLVGTAPIVAGYCVWKRRREGRGWTTTISTRAVLGMLAVLLVFAVLRNIPIYPLELLAPH